MDNNKDKNNKTESTVNIGIVVHGPEIIDSGSAKMIFDLLNDFKYNSTKIKLMAKLGGTIGRVAVIDNNLENTIDISEKLVPSESLKKLNKHNDILFLINYGKSKETGHTFGKIVVERSNIKNKIVIQIERPKEKDGTILIWNTPKNDFENKLINYLSDKLNLPVENCVSKGLTVWEENNNIYRELHGVDKGEAIMLNGIVVGRAIGAPVILVSNNKLIDIINGEIKWHGVEKLGEIDLNKVIIKTGVLRRHPSNINKNKINKMNTSPSNDMGEIIIINHAGEDVLESVKNKGAPIVITIGDDTTTICGDILARFNIKIIGITDGDRDDILKNPIITEGSNIFLIKNYKDDDVGKMLEEKLKNRNKKFTYDAVLNYIKELLNKNKIDYDIEHY
ncbi:DUF2117 domain-containing protein [Methanococcus aeolicus]|uniref:DUF2117 domain-containing protein n=1 Tax=Methanococcus aeolicus (strain ATCC BAA-1280 / DSM 17508 / OCM 812 / Nankai-3) TaxID=419665 RepID=A6UX01_META3|nr:DUF2117 domain-containing protein [Methanococcus aeolicus]ABR57023.1 conserved hypothetical protein [Methanococcus aeolicus Nankai-3]UXM85020.1 DUF2117 domain-containing protein [Methanococcus aeolicus]